MKNIIVVDIDGTISNVGERLRFIKQEPKDYDSFYQECFDDEPIKEMCDLIELVAMRGSYRVVFLTGRRESVREVTTWWIGKNVFKGKTAPSEGSLLMRPNGDKRHDTDVKIEQFLQAGYKVDDIAFVLEDRTSMVEMWRDLGVRCLQVAKGDY